MPPKPHTRCSIFSFHILFACTITCLDMCSTTALTRVQTFFQWYPSLETAARRVQQMNSENYFTHLLFCSDSEDNDFGFENVDGQDTAASEFTPYQPTCSLGLSSQTVDHMDYISSSFFSFNANSYHLMHQSISNNKFPKYEEIMCVDPSFKAPFKTWEWKE